MFKSIKRKQEVQNMGIDSKNTSLDFKLMFVYHIVMMILFGLRPISNPLHQLYLALVLLVSLVLTSSFHKLKYNWSWPGLSFSSISSLIFNLISTYIFLAFVSYTMTSDGNFPEISLANIEALVIESWNVMLQAASNPVFTPWFLAGVGIGFMNTMVSLNLATLKKSEFEAQCRNSLQGIKGNALHSAVLVWSAVRLVSSSWRTLLQALPLIFSHATKVKIAINRFKKRAVSHLLSHHFAECAYSII